MKTNIALKTLAFVIASLLLVAAVVGSIFSVAFAESGFYTETLEKVRANRLESFFYEYSYRYASDYFSDGDISEYLKNEVNIIYEIFDGESGEPLASNDRMSDTQVSYEETFYIVSYEHSDDIVSFVDHDEYKNGYDQDEELSYDEGGYVPDVVYGYDDEGNYSYYNSRGDDRVHDKIAKKMVLRLKLSIPVSDAYFADDEISLTDDMITALYGVRNYVPAIAAGSLIILIFVMVYLCVSAGENKSGEVKASFFDKIPYDVLIFAYAVIGVCAAACFIEFGFSISRVNEYIAVGIVGALCAFVASALVVLFIISTTVRIKVKKLFTNTVIWFIIKNVIRFVRFMCHGLCTIIGNLGTYAKTILALGLMLMSGFIILAITTESLGIAVFLFIVLWDVIAALALYRAYGRSKLMREEEKLARGDLAHRVDCTHLHGSMLRQAMLIGSIRDGMSLALEERMKSERFKTELITNVSHDLKTPLTSIVNYTALLRAEEERDEPDAQKIREYTEILEKQSSKLKKLTEDLVEASKASTGNLKSEPMPLEVGELITQAAGEYSERFENKGLSLIIRKPDTPVTIMADGRHMWRIFDNLLGNISKYALEGTRVYITLSSQENRATAIFRNTSKYELDTNASELTERFVRGDTSRHTEGSGLGLSIAKSLTELQGGTLDIITDGDLFKVMLSFGTVTVENNK